MKHILKAYERTPREREREGKRESEKDRERVSKKYGLMAERWKEIVRNLLGRQFTGYKAHKSGKNYKNNTYISHTSIRMLQQSFS